MKLNGLIFGRPRKQCDLESWLLELSNIQPYRRTTQILYRICRQFSVPMLVIIEEKPFECWARLINERIRKIKD